MLSLPLVNPGGSCFCKGNVERSFAYRQLLSCQRPDVVAEQGRGPAVGRMTKAAQEKDAGRRVRIANWLQQSGVDAQGNGDQVRPARLLV